MEIKKKEIVRIVLVVLLSMVMSGITAILPIYFAVPRVIYANSVPTILVSMSLGPLAGAAYTILVSVVLNNIGIGSGTIIYVLLFQILEAVVIGTCWYKKNMHIMRYILTVVLLTFLLKPFSYLFYYLFNRANMGEKSFGSYIMEMYRNYLSLGWKDTILLYATGIFAAYIIMRGIDIITKREREEKK